MAVLKRNINSVCWLIILAGAVFRIAQYIYNRSLTEGEAPLAMNILERSFAELTKPLSYVQAAPVGFLFLQKTLVNFMGGTEMVLRLFPLVAGLASLILFYQIARRILPKYAMITGLILFAVNDFLIYFASEIKQYSSDVFFALLLIWFYYYLVTVDLKRPLVILFGLAGAAAVWLSHPSIFLFCGIIAVLFAHCVEAKKWDKLIFLALGAVIWLASFGINYFMTLADASVQRELVDFWQKSFMPLPPRSGKDIIWFFYVFFRTFKNPVGMHTYEILLAILSFFIGCAVFWKNDKKLLFALMLPAFVTFLASGFHKYPFEGRLLLFLAPSFIFIIARGIDHIREKAGAGSRSIGVLLAAILLIYPVCLAGYQLFRPRAPEELRPVMKHVMENRRDDEMIYVYYGAVNAYRYYQKMYAYHDNYMTGCESRSNWSAYFSELDGLRGRGRVWFLFSHVATHLGANEEKLFVAYLDHIGAKLAYYRAPGAAAYLYDLGR